VSITVPPDRDHDKIRLGSLKKFLSEPIVAAMVRRLEDRDVGYDTLSNPEG
jgi:hypothetical protein